MNPNGKTIALILVLLAASTLVSGYTCPYTGDTSPAEYSTVDITPLEKYVGKTFTVNIVDVYADLGKEEPGKDRLVIIYLIENGEVASEYSIYSDHNGQASFIPEDSGAYAIATSGRYIFFDVLSKCGDDLCTSGETRINCAKDCATCGDGVCDNDENKEECPKDCVICGDGSCDSGENRASCAKDCATCGDGVCDINENKLSCSEDCVRCGDGVCDCQEIVSLHETTCPEDCEKCGDGSCDGSENAIDCPGDCAVCGDGVCNGNENNTCQQDCNVCGDGVCNYDENKSNCITDCVVCGDETCDASEILALHDTSCPEDCNVCGDGVCDYGESGTCEKDCQGKVEGMLTGYFLLPIGLVILIIIFEVLKHHYTSKEEPADNANNAPATGIKLEEMDSGAVMPYLLIFAVSLAVMSILLFLLGLSYERNLAMLDIGSFLLNNSLYIALIVIALGLGIGMLARGTYFMARKQAVSLSAGFGIMGMVPGLIIFLSVEYLVLMAGLAIGIVAAVATIKKEEMELSLKKPFKAGADTADRMLTIAILFLALFVFLQVLTSAEIDDKFAQSILGGSATKEAVQGNLAIRSNETEIKEKFVEPFFASDFGGLSGRLVFAISSAIVLLVVVKLFILIIKLLAGFFAWVLDKYGLAE